MEFIELGIAFNNFMQNNHTKNCLGNGILATNKPNTFLLFCQLYFHLRFLFYKFCNNSFGLKCIFRYYLKYFNKKNISLQSRIYIIHMYILRWVPMRKNSTTLSNIHKEKLWLWGQIDLFWIFVYKNHCPYRTFPKQISCETPPNQLPENSSVCIAFHIER